MSGVPIGWPWVSSYWSMNARKTLQRRSDLPLTTPSGAPCSRDPLWATRCDESCSCREFWYLFSYCFHALHQSNQRSAKTLIVESELHSLWQKGTDHEEADVREHPTDVVRTFHRLQLVENHMVVYLNCGWARPISAPRSLPVFQLQNSAGRPLEIGGAGERSKSRVHC